MQRIYEKLCIFPKRFYLFNLIKIKKNIINNIVRRSDVTLFTCEVQQKFELFDEDMLYCSLSKSFRSALLVQARRTVLPT